jgi:prevent-host-death family protein
MRARRPGCTHDIPAAGLGEEGPAPCATLSHMEEIGVRDLRNRMSQVIDAVRAGEPVVLTVRGEAVADIVPHARRSRWLPGDLVRRELSERATDPALRGDLDLLAGQTLDEL